MKKKILVVDDNRIMLSYMTKTLERRGHEVVTANDGISALDIITSFTPDIMFIDLILPRIGGESLCRIIRKMQHMKGCYLVILSGALAEVGCDITAIGANACIAKSPFNQMETYILTALEEADKPENDRISTQILGLESVYPRQMTRELFFRKRHLESILESISEGILEIDSGRIVYANSAALTMIGLPPEKLLNSDPLNLFDDEARSRASEILSLKSETPLELGTKPMELNNRLVVLKLVHVKEVPSSSIILISDVTIRTQMEMELQHARKMEAIGTIASGVAHNFRNTLAGILANSQIIEMNYQKDKELIEVIDRIKTSISRGEQLVNSLLDFSFKEGKTEFQPVDLVSLIQMTNQLMQVSYGKNINIEISTPDSLFVPGDHAGLSSVLMNLCNNARNAMPEGGTLSIKAQRKGNKAFVSIADTGYGMGAEILEKCFDPFFTTREVGKGTGLGLSTAYGIIKNHNGRISAESRPDKGSVFKIVLPLAQPKDRQPEIKPIKTEEILEQTSRKTKRVLIVDDEPGFLTAIVQLIGKLGHRTTSARNGFEALQVYKVWQPDIVLMDIGMAEMDGITSAKKIINYDPHASIVIMSGYDENGQFGINDADKKLFKSYITKPIDLKVLQRLLN